MVILNQILACHHLCRLGRGAALMRLSCECVHHSVRVERLKFATELSAHLQIIVAALVLTVAPCPIIQLVRVCDERPLLGMHRIRLS